MKIEALLFVVEIMIPCLARRNETTPSPESQVIMTTVEKTSFRDTFTGTTLPQDVIATTLTSDNVTSSIQLTTSLIQNQTGDLLKLTKPKGPPQPLYIKLVVKLLRDSVQFNWDKVENSLYTLTITQEGSLHPTFTRSGMNEHKFTVVGLPPCTSFVAHVVVNTSEWSVGSKEALLTTQTPDIPNIEVTSELISPTSANLSWVHKPLHPNCVISYSVNVNSSSEAKIENIRDKSYVLSDLEYDKDYSVEVVGIVRGSDSIRQTLSPIITFHTSLEPTTTSRAVLNITLLSSQWIGSHLVLAWSNVPESYYRISLTDKAGNLVERYDHVDKTSLIIWDTHPCQRFDILIEAFQSDILTGQSDSVTTDSWIPVLREKVEFEEVKVGDTYVDLEWKSLSNPSCEAIYTLTWKLVDSDDQINKEDNITAMNYKITELDPCRKYQIDLLGSLVNGDRELIEMDQEIITTHPSGLDPVTGFDIQVTPTEFQLRWDPRKKKLEYCKQLYEIHFYEYGMEGTPMLVRSVEKNKMEESQLVPCAQYLIKIFDTASNSENSSTKSQEKSKEEIFPIKGAGKPTILEARMSVDSAIVQWAPPRNTTKCTVEFTCKYKVASDDGSWYSEVSMTESFLCIVDSLKSCTNYQFVITTQTSMETFISEPASIEARTLADKPNAPNALIFVDQVDINRPDSVLLKWRKPDCYNTNCPILGYEAKCSLESTHVSVVVGKIKAEDCVADEESDCQIRMSNLDPNTKYECSVWARTEAGRGPERCVKAKTLEKMVSLIPDAFMDLIKRDLQIFHTSAMVTLYGMMFDAKDEELSQYYLVLSTNGDEYPAGNGKLSEMPTIFTYQNVYNSNPNILPYRTNEVSSIPEFDGPDDTHLTQMGLEKNCSVGLKVCNGPLRPQTNYALSFLLKNRWSYSLSQAVYFTTLEEPKSSIVIVVLWIIVVLVIGFVVIFLATKYSDQIKSTVCNKTLMKKKPLKCQDIAIGAQVLEVNEPPAAPFTAKMGCCPLLTKCDEVLRNGGCEGAEEFAAIKQKVMVYDCTVGSMPFNVSKNRYKNILPYDHSRVKLQKLISCQQGSNEEKSSDYINASYIPGPVSDKQFIACQGPTPATAEDFWQMVWEQNSYMIVMLTQCTEKGKNKCYQYWPEDTHTKEIGDFTIQKLPAISNDYFVKRDFIVIRGSEDSRRKITQMHFTSWPDFGCPEQPDDLINFVNTVHTSKFVNACSLGPLIVHCSAGVGRTGTFIALFSLMEEYNSTQQVNLPATVIKMRAYRVNMVQTEDQYIFLYKCLKAILTNTWIKRSDSRGVKAANGRVVINSDIDSRLFPSLIDEPNSINNESSFQNTSLMVAEPDSASLTYPGSRKYL